MVAAPANQINNVLVPYANIFGNFSRLVTAPIDMVVSLLNAPMRQVNAFWAPFVLAYQNTRMLLNAPYTAVEDYDDAVTAANHAYVQTKQAYSNAQEVKGIIDNKLVELGLKEAPTEAATADTYSAANATTATVNPTVVVDSVPTDTLTTLYVDENGKPIAIQTAPNTITAVNNVATVSTVQANTTQNQTEMTAA